MLADRTSKKMKRQQISAPNLRSLHRRGRNLLALSLSFILWGATAFANPQAIVMGKPLPAQSAVAITQTPPGALALLQQIEEGISAIAQLVNPCVVTIEGSREVPIIRSPRTTKGEKEEKAAENTAGEFKISEETLLHVLGNLNRGSITGSGFLIPGGFVVTTAEVLQNMQDPTVIFADARRVKPLWINTDKETNIAVIKIPSVPADMGLSWGNSDRVQQGNFAITLGNQGGFTNSISLGLISGKGRDGRAGNIRYRDLIQFQGVVGKGGSGGPLLNSRGQVIGMIVATPNISVGFQGMSAGPLGKKDTDEGEKPKPFAFSMAVSNIGFAVPANDIQSTVMVLSERKTISSKFGWLGISISDDENSAVVLEGIYEKGPADKAGLLPNDVILSLNGQEVKKGSEFRPVLRKLPVGETIRVLIRRKDREMTVLVNFEPRPSEKEIARFRVKHE